MSASGLPTLSIPPDKSLVLLAGPTAAGKSEVALMLAEKLGGEIVSVDSMQVYRGLDIGTAKPTPAERARIPHHLIDVAELSEPFDAARFVQLARQAVAEIRLRGHIPILCGGTGLYFRAYLEGLGEAPPANAALRAQIEAVPHGELLRELQERDPVTYEKIDRQNFRRVVRAIEVIRLTGRPFSAQRAEWKAPAVPHFYFLGRSANDLRERIDARVNRMFRQGLVEETHRLLPLGLAENKTAMQALGYRQVAAHLRGGVSLEDTVELVKVRTRQFAKRQMTWFRRQARPIWLDLAPGDSAEDVAERIFDAFHH